MRSVLVTLGVVALLLTAGCETERVVEVQPPGDLSPPLGLLSITGDGQVTLFWMCSNYEDGLDGYIVYYQVGQFEGDPADSIPGGFTVIDSLPVTPPCAGERWVDITGLTNGTTYSFLVVAASDDWSAISHASNIIEDTPRDESVGDNTIWAYQTDETQAGFELSSFNVVDCTGLDGQYDTPSGLGDIMCERFNPGAGMRAWIDGINGGEVQDIGYMSDWDDADMAPSSGYATTGHSVEALMGHVYAIKTGDNHYAKIHITGLDAGSDWIRFRAAYQPDWGNPEYR
jgi:hypothetical protein